ncbi:hypothetical protein MMC22_003899 [Lobaria immixta]|nr:hypothetical protein [Lobaria immixta]
MSAQKKIVLSKPEDWDTWISFVRIKATNQGVWNLVDPDFPVKPIALSNPIEPSFDLGNSAATFDQKAFEFYRAQHQETITAQNAVLIQKTETHPYSLLKVLKDQLALSDSAHALSLEKRYEKLKKGLGSQSIEAWVSGDRPIRNFLLAIYSKDPTYSTSQQRFQTLGPCTMDQIIKNYRQHVRLHEATKHEVESHSAFATNRKSSEDQPSGRVFSTSLKAQTTMSLSIRNFLVLDSGADIHVCNSSMAHRYTRQRVAHPDDRVESGAVMLPVESYGCLQVSLDTPIGPELITLSNVAYIPTFHTNVVALVKAARFSKFTV